jgi:hypothetical protein
MQEFFVFTILFLALAYLGAHFFSKQESHNCTKCDLNDNNKLK